MSRFWTRPRHAVDDQEPDRPSFRHVYADSQLLFDHATKRRIKWALAGSIVVALTETIGLALILPLMELVAGESITSGELGRIDAFFGYPDRSSLALILAAVVLAAFVAKDLFTLIFRWWMFGFIFKQEARTASDLLRRYLTGPYWLHLQRHSSELVRNMNDAVVQCYSNTVVGILSSITEVANITGVIVVLLVLKPIPAIVAAVYFGGAGFIFQHFVRPKAVRAGEEMNSSAIDAYHHTFHALGGVKEIKVRNSSRFFTDRFDVARLRYARAKRASVFYSDMTRYVFEVVFILGISLMVGIVYAGNDTTSTLAVLALFVAAGSQLLPSLTRLSASTATVRVGQQGLRIVLEDLKTIDEGASAPPGPVFPLERSIELQGLTFRYPRSNTNVLSDLDLTVRAGESLAIVGPSGAGKSTLVNIILCLFQPDEGMILVDGTDITTNLSGWQRSIGVVPQDVYLLDTSLRENIAFGEQDGEIDDARILDAISLAQLTDLVESLPDGVRSEVGERGARLSGGQRQRIGIARALYIRPQLLLLDEATSSLDNETERLITSTIESLHGQTTTIVVAHRLSTVKHCDRVAFLNHGRLETLGTFEEVRLGNQTFSRLVDLASLSTSNGSLDTELQYSD